MTPTAPSLPRPPSQPSPASPSTTASRCRSSASASGRCRTTRRSARSRTALEAGYRSIDTAAIYGNEEGTGKAVAASGIAREELFVTTKLWNTDQGYDSTLRAFDALAGQARPGLRRPVPDPLADARAATCTSTPGKALREDRTPTAAPGPSASPTSSPTHLRAAARRDVASCPAVNQIELHPQLQQARAARVPRRARHRHRGLVAAGPGQGPAGRARRSSRSPQKHGRTPAQVVLRWHLQLGNVVIPKSVTPSRIQENIDVFDFELDDEDMAAIAALDRGLRIGPDPELQLTVGRRRFAGSSPALPVPASSCGRPVPQAANTGREGR